MAIASIKTQGHLKGDDGQEIRVLNAGTSCAYDTETEKTFGIRSQPTQKVVKVALSKAGSQNTN